MECGPIRPAPLHPQFGAECGQEPSCQDAHLETASPGRARHPRGTSSSGGHVWAEASGKGPRPTPGPAQPGARLALRSKSSSPVKGPEGSQGLVLVPPPTLTPGVTDGDQNRLFLEKVDPTSYVILCGHREKREEEVVVVNLLSKCPPVPTRGPPPPRKGRASPSPHPLQGHPVPCGSQSPGRTLGHSQQDTGWTPVTSRTFGPRHPQTLLGPQPFIPTWSKQRTGDSDDQDPEKRPAPHPERWSCPIARPTPREGSLPAPRTPPPAIPNDQQERRPLSLCPQAGHPRQARTPCYCLPTTVETTGSTPPTSSK